MSVSVRRVGVLLPGGIGTSARVGRRIHAHVEFEDVDGNIARAILPDWHVGDGELRVGWGPHREDAGIVD